MTSPKALQKILFGSPGTGKSYRIKTIATEQLGIGLDATSNTLQNTVKTVFHPEYTHADFMGKLLPQSQGDRITYKFYPGHFLQVLGMSYRSLMDITKQQNHLLVIDELNRGNASAIFGPVFQLLDRESDGWSSYEIDVSDLELKALFDLMHIKTKLIEGKIYLEDNENPKRPLEFDEYFRQRVKELSEDDSWGYENEAQLSARLAALLSRGKISIPPNLSILATINTSDESIYYLDSAFKRRWAWEYVESPNAKSYAPQAIKNISLRLDDENTMRWTDCIVGVNQLILANSKNIRRIEDKQIGWWFIKPEDDEISLQEVQDKLMFYLWDNVFVRDRRPLQEVLAKNLRDSDLKLVTFSDFVRHAKIFTQSFEGSYDEGSYNKAIFDDDF